MIPTSKSRRTLRTLQDLAPAPKKRRPFTLKEALGVLLPIVAAIALGWWLTGCGR